jgi:exodeoxyribonuclease VII large subunit
MSSFEFDFSAPAPSEPKRLVYTPSRLNREARTLLERGFPALWVEGEISNFSRPSSGHWYFSLKDADAQLRCAMFRQKNQFLRFMPKDGMHVQIRGRVSLYEPRGDYQFIADAMEEAGEGLLRRKFELLKAKLAAEGLFAEERKRPLPRLPRRIGVITSPTGAAVRDILHVLQRRFPMIPVLIYPVPVQGATAAPQIAAAIRAASARAECDVLILARGGGSLEDLWAFNEEVVARAIYDCSIPLVSGVGHEIDFTIADLVADVRAPTPSAAAERVTTPDCHEWSRLFTRQARHLEATLERALSARADRIAWLSRRLAQLHPGIQVRQHAQRLDELEQRLVATIGRKLARANDQHQWLNRRLAQQHPGMELHRRSLRLRELQQRLIAVTRGILARNIDRATWLDHRLMQAHPGIEVARRATRLHEIEQRLARSIRHGLYRKRSEVWQLAARLRHESPELRLTMVMHRVDAFDARIQRAMSKRLDAWRTQHRVAATRLNAVSPLATLERGYAIVSTPTDHVITDAAKTAKGELIKARLAKGTLIARIEDIGDTK